MDKRRIVVSAAVGILLYAFQDVFLWARIFERDELWDYAGVYHEGWAVLLWMLAIGGFVWLWPNVKAGLLHAALVYSLAHSGLEDILYYLIQGKPLPALLPWLDHAPLILFSPVTGANLIISAAAWMLAWAVILRQWE